MLGTRAAAFSGKISNLRGSISRIQNGTMPQPTCIDLANMLKYFCQVLHDFRDFKDIENIPLYASEKRDKLQLIKTLPNFDYCGLYTTIAQLVDILPLIQVTSNGLDQLGSNLLMLVKCLVPFLDQANMETMPYLVTTLFMSLPQSLHKDILDTLCFNLLPFTIDQQQRHTAMMLRRARGQQMSRANKQMQQDSKRISTSKTVGESMKPIKSGPTHCIVRIENQSDAIRPASGDDSGENGLGKFAGDSLEDQGIGSEIDPADYNGELDEDEDEEFAMLSVTSILAIAFHHISEPMHHSQLVECLMKLKSNVFEDLLFVIAYGTTRARCPAVEILFRYWPDICPSQQDRKNNSQASKLKHVPWLPTKCQNKNCSFTTLGDDEAVKMCLDFKISITLSGLPPPMLVCLDCVDSIYKQQQLDYGFIVSSALSNPIEAGDQLQAIDDYSNKFIDLLLPMERVSKLCENKKCKSNDKSAIGTCFDIECANYNCKKPIRYCKQCFSSIHEPSENASNLDMALQAHICHSSSKLTIMDNEESVNNFVEAIISLLKEAAPADRPSKDSERYLRSLMGPMSQFTIDNKDMSIATEEKQLISQYGIWLMTGLCKTVEKISDELLGRLLGMLFQWFHFTACLPDDQAGSALEKLKGECIKGWIMGVKNQRLDVFISCLLPHPIDCSKIGGHWEVWPDTAHQIKEGFKRLLCLVPYDIITDDVWDEIMPYWMECFRHEVPENELNELKILLSKVFDPELSPLGFETKQMYNFISSRFGDPNNTNQEQTLYWLQIITMLEIPIPIDFLFQMLKSGVKSLASIRASELNKLKIASRLAELDRLPNGKSLNSSSSSSPSRTSRQRSRSHSSGQSRDSRSTSNSSSLDKNDADETNEAFETERAGIHSSASGDTLSVNEDDVMLPNPVCPSGQERTGTRAPMTQQEKQAQARAAFSARILQHASMLDAQQTGAQSGAKCPGSQPAAAASAVATQHLQHSQLGQQTIIGEGSLSPGHTAHLKSTSGSLAESRRQHQSRREGRRDSPRTSERKKTKGKELRKPKLKLQISSAEECLMNKVDNNLVCYILMLDILLKQLDLQEINSHRGLDGKEAQQAIELLNNIVSTPWLGKHTCCDSLPYFNSSSPTQTGSQASSGASKQVGGGGGSQSSKQTDFSGSAGKRAEDLHQSADNADGQKAAGSTATNVHSFSHCAQGFEHEDSYETCVLCEIISTFHQLAMSLIEFFSPVIEVSICEVSQDAANGEFDGTPDYSRIGLDHLDPSPKPTDAGAKVGFSFSAATTTNLAQQQQPVYQQDPSSPFSPSYLGPSLKAEVLSSLPKELQLTYNLLVQFHQYQTPDIVSQLLQMIKLVSLHSQVLSKAAKNNPEFITWCQHNMLVNKLWSLCQLESSEIARTCVPLLLHCITLPWGVRLFRDLVERDFNSENWLSRFRAVERVVTVAYFCEPSTIKNSTLLQSTMASAFCYVVRCLDDIEAIVAQRALVCLEMMKTSSLKLLLWCLEVQFDYIIIDRPMLLRSVFQLYNHLRDRRFLTWEFFLNRFDTIFLEAQIYLQQIGEIPSFTMQDLKNTNTKSEIYQKKIIRAKEALQETHHLRSLSSRFNEQFSKTKVSKQTSTEHQYKQSVRLQQKLHQKQQSAAAQTTSGQFERGASNAQQGTPERKHPIQSPLTKVMQHGKSTSSRYQSVAYLISQSMIKRKNSKFMANLAMQSVPPLMIPDKLHQHLPNSFVDDSSKLNEIAQENHVFGVVHRICDEDRDTNHSLIFLLMQFFSKPDPSHPQSVKTLNRNHQIVLRHLNILMGYSVARKNFLIPATNLRLLPVFNAFLTSLPKVLDFNYSLGTILLDTCLPILIYCPAPDDVQFDSIKTPSYSLWLLNPMMRQSWLMSVMAFLYKYQFSQAHLKSRVHLLMWIVINTLESHLNCSALELSSIDRCLLAGARDSGVAIAPEMASSSIGATDTEQTRLNPTNNQATDTASSGSVTLQQVPIATTSDSPGHKGSSSGPHKISHEDGLASKEDRSQDPARSFSPQSTISLRHQQQTAGTSGAPQVSASTSSDAVKSIPSGSKSLVKADTSDSLNVKAKLFQRKADTSKLVAQSGKVNSEVASATQINIEPSAKVARNIADERLLPIGIHSQSTVGGSVGNKTRSAFDLPAAERLLPIGFKSTTNASPSGIEQPNRVQPQASGRATTEVEPTTGTKSRFAAGSAQATVPNLSNRSVQSHEVAKDRPEDQSHPSASVNHGRLTTSSLSPGSPSSKTTSLQLSQQQKQSNSKSLLDKDSNKEERDEPIGGAGFANSAGASKSAGIRVRRFGVGKQHVGESVGIGSSGKYENADPVASSSGGTQPTSDGQHQSKGIFGVGVGAYKTGRIKGAGRVTREYVPKQVSTVQPSFSSPSLLNEQLALINRHSIVQEFSDKDLSMCLVILETFIHHEPSMAAHMLPNILRLVARYSSASLDSWQSGSNMHLVGGSMFVARQFIRVALHDLMENNIFHQIFTSHFTGYEFYKSMATALADFTDLNQLAPLSKLFEDLNKQKNLPQASSLMTILENVATYFECIISESSNNSQTTWTNFINNWENFLRKLILALPRFSGNIITTAITAVGRPDGTTGTTGGSLGSAPAGAPGQAGAVIAGVSGSSGTGATGGNLNSGQGSQFLRSGVAGGGLNQDSINMTAANAIPSSCSMIMTPIMRIILSTSKISHLASCKTIVDPYSKIISHTVLNSQFKYEHLLEINHNCCRLYTRDREKYLIQRTISYELVQVLKFRFFILEENLLILLQFILQDVGGSLAPQVVRNTLKIDQVTLNQADSYITNISECLRQYTGDFLEFITDVHAISRINDNWIGSQPSSINRDSFGSHVKAAISQYLALEMSLTNGPDNRTVLRYLPWLYTSPSLQQGPREFIDCVVRIRQLSWIILGSLQHSTLARDAQSGHLNDGSSTSVGGQGQVSSGLQHSSHIDCQPVPIEKNSNIAEHVQVILAGLPEQSKASPMHMSALFHAFLLCQLWTMYCENICSQNPTNSERYQFCQSTLDDFWAKITPAVLRLVGHSRVMSETVSSNFLQLIESLIESNSSILVRYMPMWNSVFYSYKRRNRSANLAIRLQKCIEWQPPDLSEGGEQNNKPLYNWLEKVQYKMSHMEIQSSQAATFYLT